MNTWWSLDFEKFKKKYNQVCVKADAHQKIIEFQPELESALENARKDYYDGNLEECARELRKLANNIKNLEFETTTPGIFQERNILNDLTGKEWLRHTKSWIIKDGKPSDIPKEIKNHPASFPPDLAKHFIEFFTKKRMWVFDPFMGIGSTLAAAQDLERHCIGIELNPQFAQYAITRIKIFVYMFIFRIVDTHWRSFEKTTIPMQIFSLHHPLIGTCWQKAGVESNRRIKNEKKAGFRKLTEMNPLIWAKFPIITYFWMNWSTYSKHLSRF